MPRRFAVLPVLVVILAVLVGRTTGDEARLKVMVLGDRGHHRPHEFAKLIGEALGKVGIDTTFTVDVAELTPQTLAKYDALMIFRDSGDLPATNETALMDFVEGGKGVVAVHCASHTFRNSSRYTTLVGGRFWKHGTGTFSAKIIDAQHPAMRGLAPFSSWDETYRHNELGDDIRVLMAREESGGYEPYTWVRQQGKGRVFYTALGHDEKTWKEPGYHALLANGVRWSAGRLKPREDTQPFEYAEAKVPNYLPKAKWGTQGEPIHTMQKPLGPAESMKHMHTPYGFEVKLFASEPLIEGKPIAMTWDERGRLWLCETVDYPNELKKQGEGRDRIVVIEDTDGDGVADKRTVFADKLSIPTSLVFANGGVIVTAVPDTIFLKDTNGDGKADERRVLFTGWGTRDTHAGPSNLRYGPDNWIWGTVGYSGFDGTVGGKYSKFSQGIFRFKPDGSALEYVTSTSNNTWGLGFTEEGTVVASTANNDQSWFLGDPKPHVRGRPRLVRQGRRLHGRLPQDAPDHRQGAAGRLARRLHGRGRARRLHGPQLPAGVLEPGRVRLRADRAPGQHALARPRRQRPRHPRRLEHPRVRRRVDRPDDGRGRAGRRAVGDRLVRVHRPTQPDAAGLPHRPRQRLRDALARQDPRPHLPRRSQGRQAVADAAAQDRRRASRGPSERKYVLASDGPAIARRTRRRRRRFPHPYRRVEHGNRPEGRAGRGARHARPAGVRERHRPRNDRRTDPTPRRSGSPSDPRRHAPRRDVGHAHC
ncbi:MAG: PVC-type heme-binding CxxCH protein [Gemmataceae bacterium]